MPMHFGAPMDENPPGVEPSVIFTVTYGLLGGDASRLAAKNELSGLIELSFSQAAG